MKKIIISGALLLSFVLPVYSGLVIAQTAGQTTTTPADQFELNIAVKNPLGDKKEIKDIVAAILKIIAEIALPIVIVMVIYSGFLYVIARGKPEAIAKAHKSLTWTLIGAAILLGAQLISTVLIETISNIGKDSGL